MRWGLVRHDQVGLGLVRQGLRSGQVGLGGAWFGKARSGLVRIYDALATQLARIYRDVLAGAVGFFVLEKLLVSSGILAVARSDKVGHW